MCQRCTTEEFIKKAIAVHGDKYDYSHVVYVNARSKVRITCIGHNHEFEQVAHSHLLGYEGCTKCQFENSKYAHITKWSKLQIIRTLNDVYKDKYNNIKIKVFSSTRSIISLTCKKHGNFTQRFDHLLEGTACQECGYEITGDKLRKNHESFILEMYGINPKIEILSQYRTRHSPMKFKCECGEVSTMTAKSLLDECRCKKCSTVQATLTRNVTLLKNGKNSLAKNKKLSKEFDTFKNKGKTPEEITLKSGKSVWWKCPICNFSYKSVVYSRSSGSGCPSCSELVGEKLTRKIFKKLFRHTFNKQRPDWLVNPKSGYKLELDGYNKKLSIAFEYNGKQHDQHVERYHGKKSKKAMKRLADQKYRDKVKRQLCKKNGIQLIVIPEFKYTTEEYALPIIMDLIKKAGIKI